MIKILTICGEKGKPIKFKLDSYLKCPVCDIPLCPVCKYHIHECECK